MTIYDKGNGGNMPCKAPASINVYHLIILDESGSMTRVAHQTVEGCNETIQTIRKMQSVSPEQHHSASIYLFSSGNSRYVIKDMNANDMREMNDMDYTPSSCTPLFDAMGDTLTELRSVIGPGAMGYVTVISDGYENDSHRFSLQMIKALVDELKEKGVIFSFIGANIDASAYARSMDIDNSLQFKQDDRGTREMWQRERKSRMRSSARMRYAQRYRENITDREFFEEENSGRYFSEQNDNSRITPEHIEALRPNEIFVFGSNIAGRHSGGAAKLALRKFGAAMGQAEGRQGSSYAIPTVGVTEEEINESVKRFCSYARQHTELTFLVTPIGCGHGGFEPFTIAPTFMDAAALSNVKLPRMFWDFL